MKKTLPILSLIGALLIVAANVTAVRGGGYSTGSFLMGGLGLALFLSITFQGRSTDYKPFVRAGLNVLFLLGSLCFLYLIISGRNYRRDLTLTGRYSLSPQSVQYIKNLPQNIRVTAFTSSPSQMKNFFRPYTGLSPRLSIAIKNPFEDFRLAQKMRSEFGEDLNPGDVFIQSGQKGKKISRLEESVFINALVEVLREGETTIYFLEGHMEGPIETPSQEDLDKKKPSFYALVRLCEERGMKVLPLNLLEKGQIPENADALVCAGPRLDIFPVEQDILRDWLAKGGRFLLLLDPASDLNRTYPRFKELAADFGMELKDDIIMDPNKASMKKFRMPVVPLVAEYSDHPILNGADDARISLFLPMARSVTPAPVLPAELQVESLMKSSPYSWSLPVKDILDKDIRKPPKDRIGPQSLACAASRAPGADAKRPARMVVFGDSDAFTDVNIAYKIPAFLFMNSISWLTEKDDIIALPPRLSQDTPLIMSAAQWEFWAILLVIIIPSIFLIGGLGYTLIRRRMR